MLVEHILHKLLRGVLGALPARSREGPDLGSANSLAHSAFRHLLYSHLGVLEVEGILPWILDAAMDNNADIDDILIAG